MNEGKRVEVIRIDRSPLNASRWCLELACGHEIWVTAIKKPSRAYATCAQCTLKVAK